MKRNGFTLIELLAMLVILGIIMVMAIPNISGMLKKQRLDRLKSDANNMVEAAKMKAGKDKLLPRPKNGECIIFSLNYLDENDNIVNGPNGGEYNKFDSVVVYTRVDKEADEDEAASKKYKYYVRLVEEYKGKREGIHLIDSEDINMLTTRNIDTIEDNIGITKNDRSTQGVAKVKVFGAIMEHCSQVIKYYSGGNYCTQINGIYYDNDGNIVSASDYATACS